MRHAVVVGAGVAGMCAARVLSRHFRRVSVLDRDDVAPDTAERRGVPQAPHPHVLLARGATELERLFPGFLAGLDEPVDFGESVRYLLRAGWAPRGAVGLPLRVVTRADVERRLRARVLADPGTRLLPGQDATGLLWRGTRVTGVRTADGDLDADLVVVAAGRASRLPRWLGEAGHPEPPVESVDGHVAYTTRLFEPPAAAPDWRAVVEFTEAPDLRRGGILVATPTGHAQLALLGAVGQHAPADDEGYLAYARTLRAPQFAEVAAGTPAGPARTMRGLNNTWTRYHDLPHWPAGLAVLGDAVCVFNPMYAQGMTVAAIEAAHLAEHLVRAADPVAATRAYQRRVARAVALPWAMATTADHAWSDRPAPLSGRLARWYLTRLQATLPHDQDLYRRFFHVNQMVRTPLTLAHPAVLARVAGLPPLRKRAVSIH